MLYPPPAAFAFLLVPTPVLSSLAYVRVPASCFHLSCASPYSVSVLCTYSITSLRIHAPVLCLRLCCVCSHYTRMALSDFRIDRKMHTESSLFLMFFCIHVAVQEQMQRDTSCASSVLTLPVPSLLCILCSAASAVPPCALPPARASPLLPVCSRVCSPCVLARFCSVVLLSHGGITVPPV